MPDLSLALRRELPPDDPAIERLHARAFGPGRYARTMFRLREGRAPDLGLSFVAHVGTLLVGSLRLTPILCGGTRALLLGPLAVDDSFRSKGIGGALMAASLDAARAAGEALVVLVGDEAYYRRNGFARVPPGRLVPPGPVDPARLLALELVSGALEAAAGSMLRAEVTRAAPPAA